MSRNLLLKFALIAIVVGVAAWLVYPPAETINYGLDLQGGAHILMQIDTDSALVFERDLTQTRIDRAFKDAEMAYGAIREDGPAELLVSGTDPARAEEVRGILDRFGDWDLTGGIDGSYRMSLNQQARTYYVETAIRTALSTLRNRVDALGVREPIVQPQGLQGDRILIQLPGVEDITNVRDILKTAAVLEWKKVSYPPGVTDYENFFPGQTREEAIAMFGGQLPDDTELFVQKRTGTDGSSVTVYWPLKKVSTLVGLDLKTARRGANQWNDPVVDFELTQDAGKRFKVATTEYLKKKMAVLLDKVVLSVPVINSTISDQGFIEGGFTVQTAEDLALKLRSGSMPVDVNIIEERTVGPSLGLDSIKAGVLAVSIGFCGVLIFMVIYYRLSGINAVVALALNILLVLGAMVYAHATLTLPGIAGLVLVVGMAVDSNVLIFERVREELRLGKTVRSAVQQGFGRAFMTILDCNVTTLVSAFFLFSYGTGPVKGFAVTLCIGLLASMFTAVFVSRQLFELVLGSKARIEKLSI